MSRDSVTIEKTEETIFFSTVSGVLRQWIRVTEFNWLLHHRPSTFVPVEF